MEQHGQRQAVSRSALRRLRLLLPADHQQHRRTTSSHDTGQLVSLEGAHQKRQLDRDRKQYNLAATYFLDTGKGSHTFKIGAELLKEQSWEGYAAAPRRHSGIEHIYNNGVSTQVIFGIPTATDARSAASRARLPDLAMRRSIRLGAFLNDTWAMGRLTINAGVRCDRYKGWLPEQEQLAGDAAGPVSRRRRETFPETDFYTWNVFAPRIGVIYDLTGDGKTVIKAQLRPLLAQPRRRPRQQRQPEHRRQVGDLHLERPGVHTGDPATAGSRAKRARCRRRRLCRARSASTRTSRRRTRTRRASWLERQLTDTMGVRAGFVYKTEDDLISTTYQPGRTASDAYTVPFTFVDIGVDGLRGTGDDQAT